MIDPRRQTSDAQPPRVLLEEVMVNRHSQGLEPPAASGAAPDTPPFALTIAPGLRELDLHYTALNFTAPENVRFRFRLDPLDRTWVEAGTRRVAYYQGIPPGHYVFRVMACNADGIWSEPVTSLTVTVRPFLWQTRWFSGSAGLAALGLLAGTAHGLARRRYKRRLAQAETRNAIERERLRISQDMHDDVGGILTRVSMLSDLGQSQADPASAPQQFERIGNQVRAAVAALDEIVWATNPRDDNLPRFAEYVGRFADECFEDSAIRCWQEIPTDLPKLPLRADVRHNVFLAVKEALHNVLKHSGATEVWLRLEIPGATVSLEIEDHGRGFPETMPPGGHGLDNMRSRLAECAGTAELASTPGQGVKIRFVFPVLQDQ
ncbi:MAG: triple tyrosine motif-containing protein [Verrucomicrobia bacterium]|nr:triple tyrosine motif-containing protein [Verrucomicrobiota bacterium]